MSMTVYADFQREPSPALRVAVVGLGYIGLPTAASLASAGHCVVGVDIDPRVVALVQAGRSHIVEPGLEALLASVTGHAANAAGSLSATDQPPEAEVYLITVPTPVGDDALRTPDLAHVFSAADAIAPVLRPGALVVLESTSPVGATRRMIERLALARPDLRFPSAERDEAETDIDVAYSPERVIPGRTLKELGSNARVVGGTSPRAARRAAGLYRSLTTGEILLTDDRSAEFVKLAENAFRDVNIAFANELSVICERLELNVWEVIQLANRHPRVDILKPGPGVGGHCIAVDPWFIVAAAPEEARLIRAARQINDAKPGFVIDQVSALMDAHPNARLACLGLTFKPDVDDFRESPALAIARALTALYPDRVACADPHSAALKPGHGLALTDADTAFQADIVLCLVAHTPFKLAPKPAAMLVDACGLWNA